MDFMFTSTAYGQNSSIMANKTPIKCQHNSWKLIILCDFENGDSNETEF